jgi:CHASE2 domain-containing sensor protein
VLAATIAVGLGTLTYLADAWAPWEGDSVDLRFSLRAEDPPDDVAVIEIDDATFSDLELQWPFPRSLHAAAIDRLRAAGVRQIAYDVQFTEPTKAREDLALYRAIERAGNVVLATTEVDHQGRTNVLGGDSNLARAHAIAAASNVPVDRGGVVRKFSSEEGGLETFAVATAARATGRTPRRHLFEPAGAWIDYRGRPGTVPTFSFADLVAGRIRPGLLRGKVVVVGASAPSLQDIHPTPTSQARPMSGPEIQANAIWTVMHGVPLRSVPAWIDLLAIIALGLAAPLATVFMRARRLALFVPLVAMGYAILVKLLFDAGWVVALTYPIAALTAGAVAAVTAGFVAESRERQRAVDHKNLLEQEVRKRTAELRETQLEVVRRLGQAADSRDRETGEHIERIGRLCYQLALESSMSVDQAELLRNASALHDLGKIGIPDEILRKPGEFTAEEREIMRTHTTIGGEILAGSDSRLVQVAELIARTHHERWDGSGYPAGLRGEEIPIEGRICSICDVFDALMSQRAYKPAWDLNAALDEIRAQSGAAFDPALVELFLRMAPRMERERVLRAEPRPKPAYPLAHPPRHSSTSLNAPREYLLSGQGEHNGDGQVGA